MDGLIQPTGALSHLTVLDFTHRIAGPLCTKLLADFGAEVIKVERPGTGDPSRALGPFPGDVPHLEKSGAFLFYNTNKLGITLNLKSAEGLSLSKELAKSVDVVVENFRPGVLSSFGLDFHTLINANPRMVLVSISNFGQTGPYKDYRATDIVAQAMGGLMYITGLNEREPLKEAFSQAQNWAGAMAATATLSSVIGARTTGHGSHVDVSIMECVASGLQSTLIWYSYMGAERRRQELALGGLNYIFPSNDGYVVPMLGSGQSWEVFTNLVDEPALREPRFATHYDRLIHAKELNEILADCFQKNSKHEIFHKGQEWGFPFGLVQTPEDLAHCPQLLERGFWPKIEHPVAGNLPYPGRPFAMSESPWQVRRPAPTLGQHNQEVYCDRLGYSEKELAAFVQSGII
jgi:CoA:oxalate CoA-transferase